MFFVSADVLQHPPILEVVVVVLAGLFWLWPTHLSCNEGHLSVHTEVDGRVPKSCTAHNSTSRSAVQDCLDVVQLNISMVHVWGDTQLRRMNC